MKPCSPSSFTLRKLEYKLFGQSIRDISAHLYVYARHFFLTPHSGIQQLLFICLIFWIFLWVAIRSQAQQASFSAYAVRIDERGKSSMEFVRHYIHWLSLWYLGRRLSEGNRRCRILQNVCIQGSRRCWLFEDAAWAVVVNRKLPSGWRQ